MATRPLPNGDILRQLLRYDPSTGYLYWLRRTHGPQWWNTKYAGTRALTVSSKKGYLSGTILRRFVSAHHAIWCIHHDEWPDQIDHIDGDPANNKIENLRKSTTRENCRNRSISISNRSGHIGIHKSRNKRRWIAVIGNTRDGHSTHLGTFDTLDEAIAARKAAELRMGYHPNHGRKANKGD